MNEDVTRRSFLKTTTAAIATVVATPAGAACQKSRATKKPNDAELAERIDALIKKLAARDEFSGCALIARDGKPLLRKASGSASKEFNVPNQPDTKFNVASMGKMFTGVAVAQLAEQGKLSFTDTIRKHLPDYPRETADQITIHHLLTHTSGMGSYWKDEFHEANHARFRRIQDYFPLFMGDALQFSPGEKWSYSNAGFMTLGAIIEKASGQSYFDYVRDQVFFRAGMRNTDFYEADRVTPNLAAGYTKQNRYLPGSTEWTHNIFISPVKGSPAGGAYSTVDDLMAFDAALRSYKLLGQQYAETVLTGKIEYRPGAKYAYGFANEWVNGERIIFHDGGANGVSAQLDMYPESGYVVAVLSNYDHPAIAPIVETSRGLITGRD
jgi:CubicO group peptidase (beta-lactamase class C family)